MREKIISEGTTHNLSLCSRVLSGNVQLKIEQQFYSQSTWKMLLTLEREGSLCNTRRANHRTRKTKNLPQKFPKIAYVSYILRAAVNLKLPNARPVPGRGHFYFATGLMPSEFLL